MTTYVQSVAVERRSQAVAVERRSQAAGTMSGALLQAARYRPLSWHCETSLYPVPCALGERCPYVVQNR